MAPAISLLCAMIILIFPKSCFADAVYQWSVPVESMINGETNDHPRAFLWIPPYCKHVRAVIVGQHNMEEEPILENQKFRDAMSELGFAEIWITPSIDLGFNLEKNVGVHFDAMLNALALESGYTELQSAPIIPIGHSASASFPWNYALWNPSRTLAVLSVSGQWPIFKNPEMDFSVPGLVTMGDYEAAANRISDGLKQKIAHPHLPLSMIAEMGGGHFDASERKIKYIILYLKKVALHRLNADGKIQPIDAAKDGWLADRWRVNDPPKAPAAAVGKYTGDPNEAFWYFDKELAQATEYFHAYQQNKKAELIGYVQNNKIVEQNPKLHAQVQLKFIPLDDGVSFKLTNTFLDTVPEGRPEGWTGLPKGSPVTHGSSPITITRICGPMIQTGPDTWSIRFYRMGMNNSKRTNDLWFFASTPGDDEYKRAVQQSNMRIPMRNNAGADQHITFPTIADQPADAKWVKLSAISDSKLPVYYYVRQGPAEIDGDTLKFTPIPPRSQLPVKVTVVAWQYGRSTDPKIKSADPVEQTFNLGTSTKTASERDEEQSNRKAIWAKATDAIRSMETAAAEEKAHAMQAALTAPNTISVHFCKSILMRPGDFAGAEARVGNWNNLKEIKPGKSASLNNVIDKNGNAITGMTITFTVGNGGEAFDANTDDSVTTNDARLFNGIFDQYQGNPSTIEISKIPYARYDVYLYRSNDGEQRAGKFSIGSTELLIRGGKENPAPNGKGYVRSTGKLDAGNYVKFENITGSSLKISIAAVNAGDSIMRNKVVGFQIVEKK